MNPLRVKRREARLSEMSAGEIAIVLVVMQTAWIVKAITGMGGPILVIPVASLFVDVETAVAVVAFPNLVSNGLLAWRERDRYHETRDLPTLAAAGVVGAIGGAFVFVHAPEEPLVALLVVAIVVYVVAFFVAGDLRTPPDRSRRWAPVVGVTGGAMQGAIGISGPIIGSWIHSYRLPRDAHVLSVTSLFLLTGTAQFVVIAANGELAGRLLVSVLACGLVFTSIPIGTRLRGRLDARTFDLAIIGLLVVAVAALAVRTFV